MSFIFICLDIERIMENICDRRFWVSSTVVSGVSKSFVWIGFGWFPLKPGAAGGADGPPRGLGRALSGSGWRGETIFWKAKPFCALRPAAVAHDRWVCASLNLAGFRAERGANRHSHKRSQFPCNFMILIGLYADKKRGSLLVPR
jgi:hypothetical protein